MIARKRPISPSLEARITGALYFISGSAFTYAENTVRKSLVVAGDASATAGNIARHLPTYRLGLAADLVSSILFLIVTLLLYDLLRPVSRPVARIAATFSLVGCIVGVFTCFLHFAPMVLLESSNLSSTFSATQQQSLALESLILGSQVTNLSMIFFGCFNVFAGYLIIQSRFMPWITGALLSFAGACYLVDYFAWVLNPEVGAHLLRYLVWEGTAGEGSLILWLLIFGVNSTRWFQRAGIDSAGLTMRSV